MTSCELYNQLIHNFAKKSRIRKEKNQLWYEYNVHMGSPLLIKRCSHCNNERFYCSDKFRMNAQKRNIDVWLIYRCTKCDNTCNLTILSRSKPDLIDKALFHGFSMNDRNIAWRYAFSTELERKNNIKLDYSNVGYEVISNISEKDIANTMEETLKIQIKCDFEFNLRLSSFLRGYFSLSANQLKRIFEQEIISVSDNKLPQRQKIKNGDIILIQKSFFLENK